MDSQDWDLFICHAHEDQEAISWPLEQHLKQLGMSVWLDKHNILPGDSIRQQIDHGIHKSRNGVLILSPSFFQPKYWTKYELDGLFAKESEKTLLIIPVWHQVSKKQVMQYSASLADRYALSTDIGFGNVADKIKQRIQPTIRRSRLLPGVVDEIADALVTQLKQGTYDPDMLASRIDEDVMHRLRTTLEISDTSTLLDLMRNQEVRGGVRNTAVSVLLGKRLKSAPAEETHKAATAMCEYYRARSTTEARDHASSDSWLVSRGIALALAGTNNGDACLLDWLQKLKADRLLLEKNLSYSEEYKGSRGQAIEKYCKSIDRLFARYPSGRLWEVFYLGYRAEPRDPRIVDLLKRCRNETDHAELKGACREALLRLGAN